MVTPSYDPVVVNAGHKTLADVVASVIIVGAVTALAIAVLGIASSNTGPIPSYVPSYVRCHIEEVCHYIGYGMKECHEEEVCS